MEFLVRMKNRIMERMEHDLAGTDKKPMTAKEKWLIFLLAGLLLALLFWPQSKTESADESKTGIFRTLNEETGDHSEADSAAEQDAEKEADGGVIVTGSEEDYAEYLSQKLTAYLSQMDGAGKVEAWVMLKSGEQEVLYEEKSSQTTSLSEEDSQGGTREEKTEDVTRTVIFGADGNPYVVQTTLPQVQGVLVLAEGGDDSAVRLDIVEAVQVLFGLDAHKIKVVKKKVEE